MRKSVLFLTALLFISPAVSETATFETDSTNTVTVGGEQIQLELIGVNEDQENPGKFDSTFIDSNDMTYTVLSWNAHQYALNGYPYLQSEVNGQDIVLETWSGADTTDTNTDDTVTLAWGDEYFPCENYQTTSTEYKFCGDETVTVEANGNSYQLEFIGIDRTNSGYLEATFTSSNGGTYTFVSSEAIMDDQQNFGYLNDVPVTVEQVRGLNSDRTEDDAVLIDVKEKRQVSLGESFQMSQGDRVQFGDDPNNYFQFESVRQSAAWIIPDARVDTGVTDRLGIVDGSMMDINFPSGAYLVHVESVSGDKNTATFRVEQANPFADVGFSTSTDGTTVTMNTNTEATGGVDSFEWDVDGDGNYEETGREASYTYESGGDKSITMRATAGDFTETATNSVTVQSPTCTYDFMGSVSGYTYESNGVTGEIHIGDGMTQVARDGSFGFTKTADCGSTVTVEYVEDGNTVASTDVQVPQQGGEINEIQIDAAEQRSESDYTMFDYQVGATTTLSPGSGVEFGQSRIFLEDLYQYDQDTIVSDAWADQISWDVENIDRYRFGIPSRQYSSTVQEFNDGEHAVGTCEIGLTQVTFVVETLDNTNDQWPDAWCQNDGRPGFENDPDAYTTREMSSITDYIGGNIPEVENMTEIRFGDNSQNSLFVKETYDDGYRSARVVASPGSPENQEITLNWDSLVEGTQAEFSSGSYTVHLCSRGDNSDGKPHMALSKEQGTSGYDACFADQNDAERTEWNTIEYNEGGTAKVEPGDRLQFGNDYLYIDSLDQPEGFDRYQMDGYRQRPASNFRIGPVEGTTSSGYFMSGEKSVHFCNYNGTIQKAKIAVTQTGTALETACTSETAAEPEGTISLDSSTYSTGSEVTADYEISQEGQYEVRISLDGQQIETQTVESSGILSTTVESSGTLTADLVAPGSWWNPLDSDRTVGAADASVNSGAPTYSFNENSDTLSWGEKVVVNQGSTLSPVYWGEGLEVTRIGDNSARFSSLQNSRSYDIPQQGSNTIYQDYVMHVCSVDGNEAEVIPTSASETTSEICETEAVDTPSAELNVPSEVQDNQTLTVEGQVDMEAAREGYRVSVSGPGLQQELTLDGTQFSQEFQPQQTGEITVQILPTRSLVQAFNPFSSGQPLTSATVTVVSDDRGTQGGDGSSPSGWRGYCADEGYSSSMSVGQARQCIQNDVVPQCFQAGAPSECQQVGQSLCEDLYSRDYDRERGVCVE